MPLAVCTVLTRALETLRSGSQQGPHTCPTMLWRMSALTAQHGLQPRDGCGTFRRTAARSLPTSCSSSSSETQRCAACCVLRRLRPAMLAQHAACMQSSPAQDGAFGVQDKPTLLHVQVHVVNQANAFCRAAFDTETSASDFEDSMQCINCTNTLYYRCALLWRPWPQMRTG